MRRVTTARLRQAIQQALPCTPAAQQVAHAMSSEHGLDKALQAVEAVEAAVRGAQRFVPVRTRPREARPWR
ncbi:hypothetical protein [Kineococcus sp. SYSU DK003]|uniref:hypothetical protein n=1 Tax=Kineococcus sp. SYSU DK003 TaxID=3383124 RepID=UPI003D7D1D41